MTLVVLFGPPAVGKMAVGRELAQLTGLRLFHNHLAIEPVLPIFPFGSPPFQRITTALRRMVFEETAASDLPGLIFTYVWALDFPAEKDYIDSLSRIFSDRGGRVCYAELAAPFAVRQERNVHPERLAAKASKRDVAWSQQHIAELEQKYRMNTRGDFYYPGQHLLVDNALLSPLQAAQRIRDYFGL